MKAEEAVVYLCKCAVNGAVPEKKIIDNLNLKDVYAFASFHMLSAMVAMALESAGCRDEYSVAAMMQALKKNSLFDLNRKTILDRFEQAGIWYMPLKGTILKEYYPKYGMREMADNDILIDPDRTENVRSIMESLGFQTVSAEIGNHDVYFKEPAICFEIHAELFEKLFFDRLHDYYKNVKEQLIKDEGNRFGYHFAPEDFYVYMVAHEYKHYSGGGTGLRSLLDTYVYLKNVKLDMDYVAAETEKIGVSEFENQNRTLAQHVFSGTPLSEWEQEMLAYILSSGTHGTAVNRAENRIAEEGQWRYFLSRLLLSREEMLRLYPVLKRIPALYPFCAVYRLIHGFFFKHDKFIIQLKTVLNPAGISHGKPQGSEDGAEENTSLNPGSGRRRSR